MEGEGIEKILFPQFGNRKGIKKNIPRLRKREGNGKKNILKIQEREGNEKINSHNSGMGIRGFHSREWTGTGIPAHPYSLFSTESKKRLILLVLTLGQGTLRSPN